MNYENDGGSPGGKIFDSYTWPDSQAPSKNITPVPLPNLRKIIKKKVVPVSSHILRSQVKKEFCTGQGKAFRELLNEVLNLCSCGI